MLQCVAAVCCSSVLLSRTPAVPVWCSVFRSFALSYNVLQRGLEYNCVAVCCSVLQCVAVCCSVLQCVAVCCSVLQCVAVCCMGVQFITVCCSLL